jgi:hypothetical protein
MNVLADKPMIIAPGQFDDLRRTLELADARGLLVNDIMTERHAITSILQRELARFPELFGTLEQGTPENPAITKESVHFFSKTVAGAPLVRPAWFFDVRQQGEAIADVSTHLVDLILWQSFPEPGGRLRQRGRRRARPLRPHLGHAHDRGAVRPRHRGAALPGLPAHRTSATACCTSRGTESSCSPRAACTARSR